MPGRKIAEYTSQADWQAGDAINLDLASSPGDVLLTGDYEAVYDTTAEWNTGSRPGIQVSDNKISLAGASYNNTEGETTDQLNLSTGYTLYLGQRLTARGRLMQFMLKVLLYGPHYVAAYPVIISYSTGEVLWTGGGSAIGGGNWGYVSGQPNLLITEDVVLAIRTQGDQVNNPNTFAFARGTDNAPGTAGNRLYQIRPGIMPTPGAPTTGWSGQAGPAFILQYQMDYVSSGTWTSPWLAHGITDPVSAVAEFAATLPPGTNVELQVRYSPDGGTTYSDWVAPDARNQVPEISGTHIQARLTLSTEDPQATPEVSRLGLSVGPLHRWISPFIELPELQFDPKLLAIARGALHAEITGIMADPLSFSRNTPATHPQTHQTVASGEPRWVYKNLVSAAWNPVRDTSQDIIVATGETWEDQPVYQVTRKVASDYAVGMYTIPYLAVGETWTGSIYNETVQAGGNPARIIIRKEGIGTLAIVSATTVGERKRLHVSYTNNTGAALTDVAVLYYPPSGLTSIAKFAAPQVEIGDKATYYTPGQSPTSLYVEEGAQNIALAALGAGAAVVTSGWVGPDGSYTAFRVEDTSSVENQWRALVSTVIPANTSPYTLSVALKQGTAPVTLVNFNLTNGTPQYSDIRIYWDTKSVTGVEGLDSFVFEPILKSSTISGAEDWWLLTVTKTNNGTNTELGSSLHPADYVAGGASTGYTYIWRWQAEAKPYATTPIDGTRAAELATIPIAGALSPTEGTWEQYVYIDAMARRKVARQYNRVFSVKRADLGLGLLLYHSPSTSHWCLETHNDANESTAVAAPDSHTPDGWHLFKVAWQSELATLDIDGVTRASIVNPKLPSAFKPNAYVGSDGGGSYLNTAHGPIRLSSIAREDDQDLQAVQSGKPLTVDEYTTGLWPLNGTLDAVSLPGPMFRRGAMRQVKLQIDLSKTAVSPQSMQSAVLYEPVTLYMLADPIPTIRPPECTDVICYVEGSEPLIEVTASTPGVPAGKRIEVRISVPAGSSESYAEAYATQYLAVHSKETRALRCRVPLCTRVTFGELVRVIYPPWGHGEGNPWLAMVQEIGLRPMAPYTELVIGDYEPSTEEALVKILTEAKEG